MASKKARKRVYIPPSNEVVNRQERTAKSRAARPTRGNVRSNSYTPPTPSLQRTLRRLPLYFLMMVGLQYVLTAKSHSSPVERLAVAAATGAVITLCFAPFMHMMDRAAYNRWAKRQAK